MLSRNACAFLLAGGGLQTLLHRFSSLTQALAQQLASVCLPLPSVQIRWVVWGFLGLPCSFAECYCSTHTCTWHPKAMLQIASCST
jgi:hypothetical protein